MSRTFDFILAFGAIVIGIMLLTGNGAMFMKGGNDRQRKVEYDQKKSEKAFGVAMLLIGVVTGIDSYTTGLAAKITYIVILLIIFTALIIYLRTKCRK